MTRRAVRAGALVVLAVLAASACGSSKKSSPPAPAVVDMRNQKHVAISAQNNQFTPLDVEVSPGTIVTWTNHDSVAHNVQKSADAVDFGAPFGVQAGDFGAGRTYSFTFTKVGEFHYTCTIHTLMNGTVRVVSATPATPTS
jgi:plastocyanin